MSRFFRRRKSRNASSVVDDTPDSSFKYADPESGTSSPISPQPAVGMPPVPTLPRGMLPMAEMEREEAVFLEHIMSTLPTTTTVARRNVMVLSADPSLQATAAELSVYMSALWRYEPGLYVLVASFIDFDALEKNNDDGGTFSVCA